MNTTIPLHGDDNDDDDGDDDTSTMTLLAESSFEEDYEAYYSNNNKIDNNIDDNSKRCGGSRRGKASNKERNLHLGGVTRMQVSFFFFFFVITFVLLTQHTTFYAFVVHFFRITLQGIVMAFAPTTTATFVVVSGCARLCSSASGNEFRVGTHSLFNGATRLVNLARHHTRRLLLLSICLHTEQVLINLMTASG